MSDEVCENYVHKALQESLPEGCLVVQWVLTAEVVDTREGGMHYLSHRSGGGDSGHDKPTGWAAIGLLTAALDSARSDLTSRTVDVDEDDVEIDEDEDEN